jgi:pyruvate/2-oxoglutarate dehydrogenase complex dihydrolipoamide acyltransferase (E2) component
MTEDQGSRRSATERADELLTRVGWTAGIFASMAGRSIARVAAFAREEVEDMWAEAQTIRRQNGGNLGAAAGQAANAARSKAEETAESLRRSPETPSAEKGETEQSAASDGGTEPIKATQTARRLARELDVDIRQVAGTGAGGQITAADVRNKAKANFVG